MEFINDIFSTIQQQDMVVFLDVVFMGERSPWFKDA